MKKLIDAEVAFNSMKLRQMGADVKVINSKMSYVKFDINGFKVSYVYNINKHGKYFLERISPYPIALREFDDEDDIIEIIKIDLEQFRNAVKSHNIKSFIDINRRLSEVIKKFEDLFLYYNVPEEENTIIYEKLNEIEKEIEKTKNSAKRVYHKKDPDFLK